MLYGLTEAVRVILALSGFIVLVPLARFIGLWVLLPVDQAAKDREHPTQFTIIDFFCLFFIIQLAMAIIHWQFDLSKKDEWGYVFIFDAFAWFACGALWMKSVQLMSRAGIERPLHRVVFLAFIIPATLIAVIGTPILLSLTIVNKIPDREFLSPPGLFVFIVLMSPLLYASAKLTRRIVAAAEPATMPPTAPALVDVELIEEAGVS